MTTFQLFLLPTPQNGRLAANVRIEGPIASDKIGQVVDGENGIRSSEEMTPVDTWNPHRFSNDAQLMNHVGSLLQDAISNWPTFIKNAGGADFQSKGIIQHVFHIDYTHSGEDEDKVRARAEISLEMRREEQERQRRKLEEERNGYSGGSGSRNNNNNNEQKEEEVYEREVGRVQRILPDTIEPYEYTKRIKSGGWYRLCVEAAENDILAEMDIRNSAVFGGVNHETGHVWTFDDWEEWEEEQRIQKLSELKERAKKDEEARKTIEQLNDALKDQVENFDLEKTQRLMSQVNNLVSQMQQRQSAVQQRIKSHEGIAKRNYQKIKKSGIIETLLYLVITGYQVYTVHNWLLSSNSLGR